MHTAVHLHEMPPTCQHALQAHGRTRPLETQWPAARLGEPAHGARDAQSHGVQEA